MLQAFMIVGAIYLLTIPIAWICIKSFVKSVYTYGRKHKNDNMHWSEWDDQAYKKFAYFSIVTIIMWAAGKLYPDRIYGHIVSRK